MDNGKKVSEIKATFIFFLIPTFMLIIGYLINPYPPSSATIILLQIPMFLGLISLGLGVIWSRKNIGKILKILGWGIFALFWSLMPSFLYFSENEDIFNAVVCILGVYVLTYLAYHEWLSLKKNEDITCLNWIAGASSIAGLLYFGIEKTFLQTWLRETVAGQSGTLLNYITGDVWIDGVYLSYKSADFELIFACTAFQAMVVFIGMILSLSNVKIKIKIYGLLISLVPIYLLNVGRNSLVLYLVGEEITDFYIAHNVITKLGALFSLIIILILVIKIIPEILDNIAELTKIYNRNGPLENTFKKLFHSFKK